MARPGSLVITAFLVSRDVVNAGELYSNNAVCHQNHCVNPVFPALFDLDRLETLTWQCQPVAFIQKNMRFCQDVVDYDVALPVKSDGTVIASVLEQDSNASTMFFYHLAGLNMDAWEFKDPAKTGNECVSSIKRLVCSTYFPRSEVDCTPGAVATYLRPCRSVCEDYRISCDVECCDESVSCVFNHTVSLINGSTLTQRGYVDADEPSQLCTGSRSAAQSSDVFFACLWVLMIGGLGESVL